MNNIHDVGENFNIDELFRVRELTKEAIYKVQEQVTLGITEKEGKELIVEVLKNLGCEKYWHDHKFRIGKNTTLSFREKSDQSTALKENDIYFIDIGPVFDNYEGDYGETFCFGESKKFSKIISSAKEVFERTVQYWREESCTGVELYNYASKLAKNNGYKLNKEMKGHRIGDFPHHLYFRGGASEVDKTLLKNLWILEIHLVTLDDTYGAFYEDIIY